MLHDNGPQDRPHKWSRVRAGAAPAPAHGQCRCCAQELLREFGIVVSLHCPMAKKALTSLKISLGWRSSRTSRSSSGMRCCSAVVGPKCRPVVTPGLAHPAPQCLGRVADLDREELDGRPLPIPHHAHRALDNFRGKLRGRPHRGAMLSNEGASADVGAIHSASPQSLIQRSSATHKTNSNQL